jgi:phage terminase large subunit-like protein
VSSDLAVVQQKIEHLQKRVELLRALPHRHLHKHYRWSRIFFESRDKMRLLTAANQIGKSTVQIETCLEWIVNKDLWPLLWPGKLPRLVWYMYPSREVATQEWETKWQPLMPPEDDPEFGWKESRKNGLIESVKFNTGILLVFKVYAQKAEHLQSATVAAIFCDEELPADLWDELKMRINAMNGYFRMVFTATLGQEFWRQAMEPTEEEISMGKVRFPKAGKQQISLFDCKFFEDGSPSDWSEERISEVIAGCGTHNEVLRRVYGRFVVGEGRKYEAFSTVENTCHPIPVPENWMRYVGIDSGAGGTNPDPSKNSDPAAITFVAVRPDMKFGCVYKAWRGDQELTTSADIIQKFLEMRGKEHIEEVYYDYSDKDLHTIASRMGEGFIKADKSHERGEGMLNTLFKHKKLVIFNNSEGLQKLSHELSNLKLSASRKAPDHLCDALRYAIAKMPWDFSDIGKIKSTEKEVEKISKAVEAGTERGERHNHASEPTLEDEFEELNNLCEV